MRDCNKCVYSTRDGNCRKFDCNGTITVKNVKAEGAREFADWYFSKYFNSSQKDIDNILSEYEKEHKNGTR